MIGSYGFRLLSSSLLLTLAGCPPAPVPDPPVVVTPSVPHKWEQRCRSHPNRDSCNWPSQLASNIPLQEYSLGQAAEGYVGYNEHRRTRAYRLELVNSGPFNMHCDLHINDRSADLTLELSRNLDGATLVLACQQTAESSRPFLKFNCPLDTPASYVLRVQAAAANDASRYTLYCQRKGLTAFTKLPPAAVAAPRRVHTPQARDGSANQPPPWRGVTPARSEASSAVAAPRPASHAIVPASAVPPAVPPAIEPSRAKVPPAAEPAPPPSEPSPTRVAEKIFTLPPASLYGTGAMVKFPLAACQGLQAKSAGSLVDSANETLIAKYKIDSTNPCKLALDKRPQDLTAGKSVRLRSGS